MHSLDAQVIGFGVIFRLMNSPYVFMKINKFEKQFSLTCYGGMSVSGDLFMVYFSNLMLFSYTTLNLGHANRLKNLVKVKLLCKVLKH
jgi:hypothetical protein